jgi:pimeloyl-ACP methyl ester carboxylesterase
VSVAVVYVHGLWLRGYEALLLRRRLARALDAETHACPYASSGTIADAAMALQRYLQTLRVDTLDLVAHSLGGLVVLKLFELDMAGLSPGRIVFLGSPVRGSQTAQRLARLPFGRSILGAAGEALLVRRENRWGGPRELGVIAGDLPVGLGLLLGPLGAANDGTVLLEETELPGATARLRLRVSHTGLPFSPAVATQTATFLREGRFAR